MVQGSKGKSASSDTRSAGVDAIHRSLEAGNPIVVGLDYKDGAPRGQLDGVTDHFVVIVGRGKDENGEYFTYFENVTDYDDAGTDDTSNRIYVGDDNVLTGELQFYPNGKFTVSMVRPTVEK